MEKLLHAQADISLTHVRVCAVAIVGGLKNRHLGFFYRNPDDKDRLYLLHLNTANLCDVDITRYSKTRLYLWGLPYTNQARHGDIIAKIVLLKKNNKHRRVPYGFSVPDNFFDKTTGEMILAPGNVGLTCATLVLAIFHMIGLNLIDYSSWSSRESDLVAQNSLRDHLETQGEKQAFVDAVEAQINGFRYRPEEVMAAALTSKDINTKNQLEPLGEEVVRKILRVNKN